MENLSGLKDFVAGVLPKNLPEEYRGCFTNLHLGLSKEEFLKSLVDSRIGYSYKENELFILAGDYCYVYGFNSGSWGKFYDGERVDFFVSNYPDRCIMCLRRRIVMRSVCLLPDR